MIKLTRRNVVMISVGVLLGAFLTTAYRYATYKSNAVHYHANFALYINGQKDEFKSFTYYEEVQACSSQDKTNPKQRVHMHNQLNHVIHVHSDGVTWGQFYANLGYTLGDNLIKTDKEIYSNSDDGNKLQFVLNGQPVVNVANKIIGDEDTLLINYGKDSVETLKSRYDSVPKDAHETNSKPDPSSCSGSEGLNFRDRLKKAIGVGDNNKPDHQD